MTKNPGNSSNILFIGIGNRYRSDDGAGLLIADKIEELISTEQAVISKQNGEATNLIESWYGYDKVIIADATYSGGIDAGTIRRFDIKEQTLSADILNCSTHSFSLADAVELARALNKLPQTLIVYGIEGMNFSYGKKLSQNVQKNINKAAGIIIKEINNLGEQNA
ncbi:MAG: hydrogenase maturation protease [Candidatus Dadabacteria bacterium]|nr:hydrogenase maturation protease [Candidatus Dadabacteria bacterium]NIS08455.1 hydrogenase maturation protease [Candidatus Dadabacteria bacterium]NIY21943.1 hydrogenase maturation protease [Candidatus Dadabacteria bacterium]